MADKTPVIDVMYRWFKTADDPVWLLAIFPGEPGDVSNVYTCESYGRGDGWGSCDPHMIVRYSKPASIGHQEVRDMHEYLTGQGLNLRIIERHDNQRYLEQRRAALAGRAKRQEVRSPRASLADVGVYRSA